MPGPRASSRSHRVCTWTSICFMDGPLQANSWICCPQFPVPLPPVQNRTHSTSFCNTRGHAPTHARPQWSTWRSEAHTYTNQSYLCSWTQCPTSRDLVLCDLLVTSNLKPLTSRFCCDMRGGSKHKLHSSVVLLEPLSIALGFRAIAPVLAICMLQSGWREDCNPAQG